VRISELSAATGVSVPTIKYYLREGLLRPGAQTAPNQASYGDEHVHRLRLIVALRELGDLSIERIRTVMGAIDDEGRSRHERYGVAHYALAEDRDGELDDDEEAARREIDAWLDRELRWKVTARAPWRGDLAAALATMRRLGRDVGPASFRRYADAALAIAEGEFADGVDGRSPESVPIADALEWLVIGTVVNERALAALRKLAQEHVSATRARRSR
jgi:DNA-binding transcriptional MerR regulator